MLERVTTSALYHAADAGYEQAARAEIARLDPLLKRSVNNQLRDAINRAIDLTGPVDDTVDEQQQMRVAYLLHIRTLGDIDPRSKDAVTTAFTKAQAKAPPSAPRYRFLTPLVLLVVLGGGGLLGYELFGPSAEQRIRRSSVGQALSKDLTKWVISLDRFRRARDGFRGVDGKLKKLTERRETLLASMKDGLGEPGVKAITEVLDRAEKIDGSGVRHSDKGEEAKHNEPDTDFVPADEKALYEAAKLFNDVLADADKPVVIDARTQMSSVHGASDLGDATPFREVVVVSYFVERRGTLKFGDKDTAVTLGKRLDNLNVRIGGDAYDTKALGGMLVSLDLAESTLIMSLMAPLSGNTPWELVPAKEAAMMEGGEEMIDRASVVLREELLGSAGVEQEVATKIAELLTLRTEFINKLDKIKLVAPRKLLLDDETVEKLEHFKKEDLEVFQVLELNDKLGVYEDSFKSILLVFADAATVRGVVYLLEDKDGEVPESLAKALAALPERYRDAEGPRRQMFADLAAIAYSKNISKTLLTLVVQSLLRSSARLVSPGPLAVLVEMAEELGIESKDPWIDNGRLTKRFPAFYKALMEKSSGDVQKAAGNVFKRISKGKSLELTWK